MRADRIHTAQQRANEITLAGGYGASAAPHLLPSDEFAAPEFISELTDVSHELADVIASANADVE